MCGYWFSNKILPADADLVNIKRRGPDGFRQLSNDLGHFAHALLITKPPRYDQPAINSHGVLLYNGSVYNVDGNDTSWLLDCLDNNLNNCIEVVKQLRGEYSITWVTDDFVMFCADQFVTRNLYYYYSKELKTISISSTPDVLRQFHTGAWRCCENTIYVIDKSTWNISTVTTTDWNLDQSVNHYDHVFDVFEESVQIRYADNVLVPLSAGYDSGVIACCLSEKLRHNISASSFKNGEDINVLAERMQKHKAVLLSDRNDFDYGEDIKKLSLHMPTAGSDRYAVMCEYSNSIQRPIHLTGRGGDEIYADYGDCGRLLTGSSKFGGYFPEQLSLIWPWHDNNYLIDKLIAQDFMQGYFGTEPRVPLLDQKLVQTWLNTSEKLKNSKYKGWMAKYMEYYNYPFVNNQKTAGFYGSTYT